MNSSVKENCEEKRPSRLIYAFNYLNWGGAQMHFLSLVGEVSKEFEICALMPEDSDPQIIEHFRSKGIHIEFFRISGIKQGGNVLMRRLRLHAGKIADERAMLISLNERFDLQNSVVYAEISPWQSVMPLIWLLLRTRVFVAIHNSLGQANFLRTALWKIKLGVVSRFKNYFAFTSNEDTRKYFKSFFSEEFYKRIPVLYTNVDPDKIDQAISDSFNREDLRQKHAIPIDAFVVVCVGQFIDRKGRWTFLEAAKKIANQDSEIHFAWITNSILTSGDFQGIELYGLGDRFSIIESKNVGPEHVDLFRLVRAADLFVLASFREGVPGSLLEAMALELPCIATNVNAIPEAIIENETGRLIEPGDADGLASVILELRNDEAQRIHLAEAGRSIVLDKFNEKNVGKLAVKEFLKAVETSH